MFRRDLTKPLAPLEAKVPVRIEAYSESRYEELHGFLDSFVRPDIIDWRLDDDWTPMLAYYRGDLVAVSWFATHRIHIDSTETILDYEPAAGYTEGSRTAARVQGLGMAPAICTRICQYLKDLGYRSPYVSAGTTIRLRRMWPASAAFNLSSR